MDRKSFVAYLVSEIARTTGFPYAVRAKVVDGECQFEHVDKYLTVSEIVGKSDFVDLIKYEDENGFESYNNGKYGWIETLIEMSLFGILVGDNKAAEKLAYTPNKYGKLVVYGFSKMSDGFYSSELDNLLGMSKEERKTWLNENVQRNIDVLLTYFDNDLKDLKNKWFVRLDGVKERFENQFYVTKVRRLITRNCNLYGFSEYIDIFKEMIDVSLENLFKIEYVGEY